MDARDLARTPAVRDFALAMGEWLLARRFGVITPLAFRYYLGELFGFPDEVPPHVVIDLLVNDPPPPPPEWLALSEEERRARSLRERVRPGLWPFADMRALEAAATAHAREVGVPDAIDDALPVMVALFGRTDAKEMGLRFPMSPAKRLASARCCRGTSRSTFRSLSRAPSSGTRAVASR